MSTSQDWQTARRLQAVRLHEKGWQQKRIAEALGVTKGAISQWLKKARGLAPEQQAAVLRVKKSTGRPPAINPEQGQALTQLVERGPEAFGFVGNVWTTNRVRAVARRELGLSVGVTTVNAFLHGAGFSVQKPTVVATQKNPKAVAGFRGGWVNLKKGPSEPERP